MFVVRRVRGKSMLPAFQSGQLVIGWRKSSAIKPGDVLIFRHEGLEKIKRVARIDNQTVFVVGDNQTLSTDSRAFGALPRAAIIAKVVWPRR